MNWDVVSTHRAPKASDCYNGMYGFGLTNIKHEVQILIPSPETQLSRVAIENEIRCGPGRRTGQDRTDTVVPRTNRKVKGLGVFSESGAALYVSKPLALAGRPQSIVHLQ